MKIDKSVKSFSQFVNESEESPKLYEDKAWYVKNGYVTDPSVKSKEDLDKLVMDNIESAWSEFAKGYKELKVPDMKFSMNKGRQADYIRAESENIDEKDLGVFGNTLAFCKFAFFGGCEVNGSEVEGEFMFKPDIWTQLHLSYESKSGGGNGMAYPLSDDRNSDGVVYEILGKKWITFKEWVAKNRNKNKTDESEEILEKEAMGEVPVKGQVYKIFNKEGGKLFHTAAEFDGGDKFTVISTPGKKEVVIKPEEMDKYVFIKSNYKAK